jgi:hypothetical protein
MNINSTDFIIVHILYNKKVFSVFFPADKSTATLKAVFLDIRNLISETNLCILVSDIISKTTSYHLV